MIFHAQDTLKKLNQREQMINQAHLADETAHMQMLLDLCQQSDLFKKNIHERSLRLIESMKKDQINQSGINAFMTEYDLSSEEGIALMCVAEALLRIPDAETANKLIRDKIAPANWQAHLGNSPSVFVNSATWSLMLTGKLLKRGELSESYLSSIFERLLSSRSESIIRTAMQQGMKIVGKQFVKGETIKNALHHSENEMKQGYLFSYDMLGEGARTESDAVLYFSAYLEAIEHIGNHAKSKNIHHNNNISVKLSALHPRYEIAQNHTVMSVLYPRLKRLAEQCAQYNISLTIDAEESTRLEISLKVVEQLCRESSLSNWSGLSLAVQAYQKRAPFVIDWLLALSQETGRRFMVRLVKGAYWDTEIKQAQVLGLEGYPVFTRKSHTDVSYIACAMKLLQNPQAFYPMFATHNAVSLATIIEYAHLFSNHDFEFQRLHGMGDSLYRHIVGHSETPYVCRIYAPVGTHQHLLAYLVRRLLENGANTSFVNQMRAPEIEAEALVQDPIEEVLKTGLKPHANILNPRALFGKNARRNSKGLDLSSIETLFQLDRACIALQNKEWKAGPLPTSSVQKPLAPNQVRNPAQLQSVIGEVRFANADVVHDAFTSAKEAFESWSRTPVEERASCLERFAELLEERLTELMYLAIVEAGKTIDNALGEVREAIDFCRYYAQEARRLFAVPETLPGPTGEYNTLTMTGRGVILCISPWNFPLAIFLGEVTAALAAGNTVIAKPAPQTNLIAARAIELLYEAGLPQKVVHLVPGSSEVGSLCVSHPLLGGIIFTGSTQTARKINQSLAARSGPILPFIAETGGQNCMIVDSSALPEQVVMDVIRSAFDSAGQRCSALRVLYLQADIAENVLTMLMGAMDELIIGNPAFLQTDIGPVIDQTAKAKLDEHIEKMSRQFKLLKQCHLDKTTTECGTFVPPTLIEIPHINVLEGEVFGPILHIIRFKSNELDQVIAQVNSTGFGLTFGIHSRIQDTIRYIIQKVHVGNCYVNRNIIGAVVGVQPFGGEGLSGTGPKAGGPHYLSRLVTERTLTMNTTAAGGNTTLMTLTETEEG